MGWVVRVGGTREVMGHADIVIAQWWDLGATGVAELEADDLLPNEIVGGFVTEDQARAAAIAAGDSAPAASVVVEIDDTPWGSSRWQYVEWRGGLIAIQPGEAFGHGRHPTTALCLELLADLELTGREVIDVGTGTGVLAIAAALGGASPVWAVDNDPAALAATSINAEANKVALRTAASIDAIPRRSSTTAAMPAPIVLVNMLTTELAALMADHPVSADLLARAETVVHAGFLAEARERAEALFPTHRETDRRFAADASGQCWGAIRWERS